MGRVNEHDKGPMQNCVSVCCSSSPPSAVLDQSEELPAYNLLRLYPEISAGLRARATQQTSSNRRLSENSFDSSTTLSTRYGTDASHHRLMDYSIDDESAYSRVSSRGDCRLDSRTDSRGDVLTFSGSDSMNTFDSSGNNSSRLPLVLNEHTNPFHQRPCPPHMDPAGLDDSNDGHDVQEAEVSQV